MAPLHWATGSLQPWASLGKNRGGLVSFRPHPTLGPPSSPPPHMGARGLHPHRKAYPLTAPPRAGRWEVASPFGTHPGLCFERDFQTGNHQPYPPVWAPGLHKAQHLWLWVQQGVEGQMAVPQVEGGDSAGPPVLTCLVPLVQMGKLRPCPLLPALRCWGRGWASCLPAPGGRVPAGGRGDSDPTPLAGGAVSQRGAGRAGQVTTWSLEWPGGGPDTLGPERFRPSPRG